MGRKDKPKQRSNPLSAGDGLPALMRQAGEERGKMGDTERDMEIQECVELVPSLRGMAEAIREDQKHIQGYVDRVVRILEIVAEEPGTTVQDALYLLEDARKTLLQYQMIS